ncbi:WD40-repeat-containing domain protein [Globomyces pollinis-pini]|nr:WD40-repeat-containing domain protein [Globomyces pollinis-pini]
MLKSSLKAESVIQSIYTGGRVIFTNDILFSTVGDDVHILHLSSGLESKIQGDAPVTCFAVAPDLQRIIVAYQNLLLITLDFDSNTLETSIYKSYKVHEAPVLAMDFDPTSTLIATGSADSTVKCFDVEGGHCTHNFKGHSGIISVVKFHPDPHQLVLASGSDDCKVKIWSLHEKRCLVTLDSHVSIVRGLAYSPNGQYLFSGSRDKVFSKWDLEDFTVALTVPVLESVEALEIVYVNEIPLVCTAGEKGVLKIWDMESGKLMIEQESDPNYSHEIVGLGYYNEQILAVTSDQNLQFYKIEDNEIVRVKQIAGYNEEILDLCTLGENDSHLAVITNTEQLRVYNLETKDCDIVYGHSDIVLSVSTSYDNEFIITGSKDHTAKLWKVDLDATTSTTRFEQVRSFVGHTGAVTAVVMAKLSNDFCITTSQDRTVKFWGLNDKTENSKYTFQAHDMDIQSLDVAPNDQFFASAGRDKTAKLWSAFDGSLVGVFKGHKRGIWKVKFSPMDQAILTCSTDKTIKLWNIKDFSCTKTFEGHLNTVLNVSFITAGMQFVSTGSDGLVKLWNVKDGECVGTFDNHEDRIWALSVNKGENHVYTGSSDSTISIWRDVTEEEKQQEQEINDEKITKEQDLTLFLKRKDYKNAIILAMQLDQPFKILKIITDLRLSKPDPDSITGSTGVDQYLINLPNGDLQKLLLYIRDWNTHSKHSRIAQLILNIILKNTDRNTILELPKAKEILESLATYSERHLEHSNRMIKDSFILDYTLERMDSLI